MGLDAAVDRYIRQSRLARKDRKGPWQHDKHSAFLADVLARLGPQGPIAPPKLRTVSTINAEVEILTIAQQRVLIFDRDVGEALFALTRFAIDEQPDDILLAWGLGRMAAALTVQNDFERAFAALSGSVFIGPPPPPPPAALVEAIATSVLVQEYFAIAHECVHMAIADGRLVEQRRAHLGQVQRIADRFKAVAAPGGEASSHVDPLIAMQGAALSTILSGTTSGGPDAFQEWLVETLPASMSKSVLDGARAHLGEELMCDALATELTLAAWGEQLGEEVVVAAIFNGLSNLQSIEYLRFLGQAAASRALRERERGLDLAVRMMLGFSTNTQAATRRVVWRRWMSDTRDDDSEALWASLSDLTERHSRNVSAKLQLLPEKFTAGYETMKARDKLVLNGAIAVRLLARGCDGDVLMALRTLSSPG